MFSFVRIREYKHIAQMTKYRRNYFQDSHNEKLQNVTKAITLKTLEFTSFLALFYKILVFLLMVYRETDFCPKIEKSKNP